MKQENKFKIVISSGKGGVGKSMLTSGLAMLFAKKKKVIALDCDVDAPNLAIWLGEPENWQKIIPISTSSKPTIDYKKCDGCGLCAQKCQFGAIKMAKKRPVINPFLCEGCGLCEMICPKKAIKLKPVQNGEIRIKKTRYGFWLVSGHLIPGETGSGKIVDKIKEEADKFNSDLMIIDSAPGTGCPVIAAIKDANFVLLVTEPTPSGVTDLKKVLKIVQYFKIKYGIVINKWDINRDLSRTIQKWSNRTFLGKISYNKEIFRSVSYLQPIMETNLITKKEIEKIFQKLNKIIW
ncbi:ATP-binding protein [bacterium]|nr:ATP-binding protein [bacterium]